MSLRTVHTGTDRGLHELLKLAAGPRYAGLPGRRALVLLADACYPGPEGGTGRGAGRADLQEAFLPAAAEALAKALAANPGHPGADQLALLLEQLGISETEPRRTRRGMFRTVEAL